MLWGGLTDQKTLFFPLKRVPTGALGQRPLGGDTVLEEAAWDWLGTQVLALDWLEAEPGGSMGLVGSRARWQHAIGW